MEWSSQKLNEYGEIVSESFADRLDNLANVYDTILLWKNRGQNGETFAQVSMKDWILTLPKTFPNEELIDPAFQKELIDSSLNKVVSGMDL